MDQWGEDGCLDIGSSPEKQPPDDSWDSRHTVLMEEILEVGTRWAPTSYKLDYKPFKWDYNPKQTHL